MADQQLADTIIRIIDQRNSPISTLDLSDELKVDHQRVTGAIRSIIAQASTTTNSYLKVTNKDLKKFELTPEGRVILDNGSHEARIFRATLDHPDGIDQVELLKTIPNGSMAKVGFSKAMSNGWISLTSKKVKAKVDKIEDSVHQLIQDINKLSLINNVDHESQGIEIDSKTISDFKKRKLITESIIKYMIVEKDKDFTLSIEKPETDLTTGLLLSGEWKDKKFKDYNFNALGVPPERGHLHPLLKVREQFRQIFLEMGFSEMPTNNFVESSFWNFDTLVVPQAHPARDSQDTFFLSHPEVSSKIVDRELVERVSKSHHGSENGDWPRGYRYKWSEKESMRNVLRTHTTAVTARMLYKIANDYKQSQVTSDRDIPTKFKPFKLFSIDRVFRNETLDATHLAEFNQVEGVVVDENLSLGDLMGVLRAFFEKLGIGKLRFKPAYNPYTEPSMEVFSYHSGLKKWVEVGNSGIFRPEMLEALGLPKSVTAIAWGLSLERPTMIKYKIDNIRELVGHKINLKMVRDSQLCLF